MTDSAKLTKGERRRGEIIALARAILIEDGYDRLVLRRLAGKADMKLGNLQYYFATREDLIEAVGRAELEINLEMLRRIGSGIGTPQAKLKQVVEEIVRHWQREGSRIFAVMSLLALHQSRFADFHLEMYDRFYAALGDLLIEFEPEAARSTLLRKTRLVTTMLDGALFQIPLDDTKAANQEFLNELADAITKLIRP